MKTYAILFLFEFWRKSIPSSPNKIIAYLRTKHRKITRCQTPIIHAIKIVLRGTQFMVLNETVSFFVDLIEGQGHPLKEAKSMNMSLSALGKCINTLTWNNVMCYFVTQSLLHYYVIHLEDVTWRSDSVNVKIHVFFLLIFLLLLLYLY